MSTEALDYVASWATRLRTRLYTQFGRSPNVIALADLCAAQAQEIEDALQQLATLLDIGDGVRVDVTGQTIGIGAQLDRIGEIVGQRRGGLLDDLYRYYLRARVQANRSSGDAESIYRVINALLPAIAGVPPTLVLSRVGIASLLLEILDYPITTAIAAAAFSFLLDSKAAGIGAWLIYSPAPAATAFAMDVGPGLGFGSAVDPYVGGGFAGAFASP